LTDRYAVIGNPVAHSKSPWIHARFAEATGADLHYEALQCPLEGFTEAVGRFAAQGGKGMNVTLPFKAEAFALCDEVSARASSARAVNTLIFSGGRIRGDNTDGCGLTRDIMANLGFKIAERRVLLLGAGGAARGVLLPLLEEKPALLTLANRTLHKARELVDALPSGHEGKAAACGYDGLEGKRYDLVINATSAGLTDTPLPLPDKLFNHEALAYDMVYGRETAFMRYARTAGAARSADGLGMLVEQAAESFLLWRGVRPPTAPVLAVLRAP
jgi:shikimate dehydrogenase